MALTPETALAEHPFDLDSVAVYADWRSQEGDPLGEYLAITARLAKRGEVPLEARRRLSERAIALRVDHGRSWWKRWNEPLALFDPLPSYAPQQLFDPADTHEEPSPTFAGLPARAELAGLPADLAAVDRQLERLPVQQLKLGRMNATEIARLATLASLHRVPGLAIRGGSKLRLGKSLLAWLAGQQLANVQRLALTSVAVRGDELAALLATLPALRSLSIQGGGLTAEALLEASESPAASRLVSLALPSNPIGTRGLSGLAAFTSLRKLDLEDTNLGYDLGRVPVLSIEELRVSENDRMGAGGLAGLFAATPNLRDLQLGDDLDSEALEELAKVADRLEVLSIGRPDDVATMLEKVIPKATHLEHLEWKLGGGRAEVDRLLGSAKLGTLALFDATDAHVTALAASAHTAAVEELFMIGDFTEKSLLKLARSQNLTKARTLWLYPDQVTEKGIAALLDGLPALEELTIIGGTIKSAEPLCARPATVWLELRDCKVAKAAKKRIDDHWGR